MQFKNIKDKSFQGEEATKLQIFVAKLQSNKSTLTAAISKAALDSRRKWITVHRVLNEGVQINSRQFRIYWK